MYFKSVSLKDKKILNKIAIIIFKILFLPFSIQKMCSKYDKLVSKPNYSSERDESKLWTSGGIYSFEKELHTSKDFGTPALLPFGPTHIFVPERYDSFLRATYGDDYMIPQIRPSNQVFECEWTDNENIQ